MILYRLLLLVYPAPFRRRYGEEMAEAFRALHGRVRAESGAPGLALLWARTAADAVVSGTTERLFGPNIDPDRQDGPLMRALFHFRQALRSLRRAPGYALAFVLTLGLAIGVNSAVFSVVNGVLLRPLPFQDADRILYLKQPVVQAGVENTRFSFMEVDDYRQSSRRMNQFVEFGDWNFSVVGEGEPHRAVAGLVTSNYFEVLGMRPALGRLLTAEDDAPGAAPVMVLTHEYWTRALGRDPDVVGRTVQLSGTPTTIVGVLQPGMHYTGARRQDFYANYTTNDHYQGASMRDSRGHRMTDIFARLAPGADLESARTELETINTRLHAQYSEDYPEEMGFGLEAVPWQEELTRQARPTFLLLMGTVAAVLLLACVNLVNLTLTRLVKKENELATRGALGATAGTLRLHLTAENVILSLGGVVVGLGLAVASREALVSYASRFTVRAQEVGVDGVVLGATLIIGVGVAMLLAWLPGLPVAPGSQGVASAAAKATQGRWRKRVQRGLVVSQLALSFTLLAGAGLLVRSLLNLYAVDPGFRTENVLTVEVPAGRAGTTPEEQKALFEHALHELQSFPGVRSAAVASWVPLSANNPIAWSVRVEGGEEAGDRSHLASFNAVSAGYFETLGMGLLTGRFFGHMDRAETDSVIILNASMARAHFGGDDPLGRRMAFSFDGQQWTSWMRVVGVVADAREYGIDREGVHTIYRPAAQAFWGPNILLSTVGDPFALARRVREVVHQMDPDRPVENIATLEELRDQAVAPSRLNATLFGAFAVLALVIAAVGVLGVLGFSVSQRLREFGIRMALGAERASVLMNVLLEGVILVALALAFGGAAALLLGRLLSGLLFGVEPVDPTSFAGAAAVLGAVALVAAFIPARRATRVHPSDALRAE